MIREKLQIKLQTKLMFIFLVTIMVVFGLFGSMIYLQEMELINSVITKSANRELVQLTDWLNLSLSQVNATANLFFLDEQLQSRLKNDSPEDLQSDRAADINQLLNQFNVSIQNMAFQTLVVDNNGHAFGNASHLGHLSVIDLNSRSWRKKLEDRQGLTIWTSDAYLDTIFSSPGYPYVYVIRELLDLKTFTPIGLLVIGVSENYLQATYSGYIMPNESFYIINEDHVISRLDNLKIGTGYVPSFERMYAVPSDYFMTEINNRNYLVSYNKIRNTLWDAVKITDVTVLMGQFNYIRNWFILLLGFSIVGSFAASYLISKRFLLPFSDLYKSMKAVQGGNLNVQVKVRSNDEIAALSRQFNTMIANIKELMARIVSEQEEKRVLEIRSLQTQISPHFIYNTLASLRYLIQTEDNARADRTILSLTKLLRNTLSNSEELITINMEVDLLKSYIDIQQVSFDSPLSVQIDIEDSIRNGRILKLILQPIVENAIMHALKPKKGPGHLVITGKRINDDVEFHVIDDGVGLSVPLIDGLPTRSDSQSGIGVQNVNDRIKLYFGHQYGLEFNMTPVIGTDVIIRFPYILGENEGKRYEHPDR